MKLTKKIETEITQFLQKYWDTYFEGNLTQWQSFISDDYKNIGTNQEEIWNSKKEIIDYTYKVLDQMIGRADVRNKTVQIIPYDPYIMTHELGDLYVKTDDEWNYYAPIRLSSLLQKNDNGWVVLHQHGSFPDSKTQEGEAFAFDVLKSENKKLQQAVKRRPIELETKNRELEIETALERTRTQSMLMQRSEELDATSKVFHEQLQLLGIDTEFSYVWLPDEANDEHQFWVAWNTEEKKGISIKSKAIVYPLDKTEPYTASCFSDWKSGEPVHIHHIRPNEVVTFFSAWEELLKDAKKLTPKYFSNGLYYAEAFIKYGCFGINIKRALTAEEIQILQRFSVEFERTYTRFLDLQKAEEQTKEARIEASLEKVRSVALSLTKSEDMLDIAKCLYEQLLELGFTDIRNAIIDIHNEDEETFLDYDYSHDMSSAITKFSFYGDPVIEQQIKKVASSNDAFFEIELKGKELDELIETRLRNGEKDDPRLHEIDHLTYNLYSFGNGAIGISNFGILSDDQKKILKRFRNVFTFAYKRYTDLAKAESQAREAKIEAALEKVRSVALSMNESTDLLHIAKALFEQLLELGFNDIRNAIIDVNNADNKTFLDYDYSHEMGGTTTLMSYDDDPTLEEQLQVIAATTDGYSEMVLEGQQLQDLITMRRKNGEADDPRLQNADSISYILYAFGNGAIGISNFGVLNKDQKDILDRFRNVFTFAYQRFEDLQVKEKQSTKLLDEKQRLEKTLINLQQTQKQLIQSEKMASLGELTAGIAHEIQNPLNFVNNFSEVSKELLDEMREEIENGDMEEVKAIMADVIQNLEKINHHGKRADSIVKGMLQHSRNSGDKKEPTDINALADEYLRLAYHGLRAKDKSFNALLETDYDENIKSVAIVPQDIGRVILNLFTNAFYAVDEKKSMISSGDLSGFQNLKGLDKYEPTVSVTTRKSKNKVIISVKDNGNGIPRHVIDKIFQPFFTTKPTGKGTGLGLSMSYDIIKAHNGELTVNTVEGESTEFKIQLPLTT